MYIQYIPSIVRGIVLAAEAYSTSFDWALDLLLPFSYVKSMCIRQIYECNQLHRYILCVVVVIVCNEHWELWHTDRADMQFKVVFLAALISANTI